MYSLMKVLGEILREALENAEKKERDRGDSGVLDEAIHDLGMDKARYSGSVTILATITIEFGNKSATEKSVENPPASHGDTEDK